MSRGAGGWEQPQNYTRVSSCELPAIGTSEQRPESWSSRLVALKWKGVFALTEDQSPCSAHCNSPVFIAQKVEARHWRLFLSSVFFFFNTGITFKKTPDEKKICWAVENKLYSLTAKQCTAAVKPLTGLQRQADSLPHENCFPLMKRVLLICPSVYSSCVITRPEDLCHTLLLLQAKGQSIKKEHSSQRNHTPDILDVEFSRSFA